MTLSWTPTDVGVNGGTASAYEVLNYTAASGGTPRTVCSTTAPTVTCNDPAPTSGTSYYQVRARVGTNWIKESSRTPYTIDLTAPSIVFIGPSGDTNTYVDRKALKDSVKSACDPNDGKDTPACGRATDSAGVKSVEYQLRRTSLLGTTACYDNSKDWTSTCGYHSALVTPTSDAATSLWEIPNRHDDAFKAGLVYTYVLSIIATDNLGNRSAPVSITFTVLL